SGSTGPATSARYSGLVYRLAAGGLGGEESVEDAVELLWPLGLRRVAGAFDHGETRALDERVRARGVSNWKERIVGPPDQLDRECQRVQPLGQVVVTAEQGSRRHEGANRREIRARITLGC